MNEEQALVRESELRRLIGTFQRVVVAFSGGVDSSYLAFISHQVLGEDSIAVTALSPSVSQRQEELARSFASRYSLQFSVINTSEMDREEYRSNPYNRCYYCKTELYAHLERLCRQWNAEVIFDGSNADDVADYRPGREAATERGIRSPLLEVGLTKSEIRFLSRRLGLPSWDQPAMPCLSSRFPYGVEITPQALQQVEDAESFLWSLGLRNFRVRHHHELARIEVAREEWAKIVDCEALETIGRQLKKIGYRYVTFDLSGFSSGSLNAPGQRQSLVSIEPV